MTLIDLGELRDDHPWEPPVRRARPGYRVWGVLAVAVAALLTLAASLPVPGRDLVVVPARLGSDRMVVGELLLVVDPRIPQSPERSVTAYRLPAGEPVWRVPLPAEGEFWGGIARAGVVLLTGYSREGRSSTTVALDVRTGERRWQQSGAAVDLADGNVLLEESTVEGGLTLRVLDPCCGTPRWEVRLPVGETRYRFAQGADRLVLSGAEGRVEVRDTATGAVLATADLDTGGSDRWFLDVVGDLLLVFAGSPPEMTAYGLDRLDRRWRAAVPSDVYAMDCDGAICLQSRSGTTQAFAAATGRPLWSLQGWSHLWTLPGRLLAVRPTGGDQSDVAVLDPATGRVRAELGRWELILPLLPEDPLIGVRPHPDGGLFVAELDAAAGAVRPLDVLPGAAGDCTVAGEQLLCRRQDASLGLWSLRERRAIGGTAR